MISPSVRVPATQSAVVTVSVVSPFAAVSRGLAAMLAGRDEVAVVELGETDVVLYDAHGLLRGGADLDRLVATTSAAVLAVHSELRPTLGAEVMGRGALGSVDLGSDRDALVGAVLDAARGRRTAEPTSSASGPGHGVGLTPREIEVLTLITQGLSNQEIAEQRYLSINTVKTYIRSAYRRIGVTSRSQAVVWCVRHGFPSEVAA